MRLHALAGLPRSATTLLANVLAQHPDVHVSGTSALPLCIEAVVNTLSSAPEVQSDLATVPGAYERYVGAMRGLIDGWYADHDEAVVIDKGRGWVMHRALLDQLAPGAVLVVCVRDPRDVVASIERQHRGTAAFNSPLARTIYEAADLLMRPEGMVGGPMRYAEDLLRRKAGGVMWVRYESLVVDPGAVIGRVADAMGLGPFGFDFENVENTASDLDAIHRNKFPHDGSGPIKPTGTDWRDVMDEGLAAVVAGVYPLYMQTFGYADSRT
jgi:sulfotransferase